MPGTYVIPFTQIPGMDTAAYAAGDALGTELTISGVPEHGMIHTLRVLDLSDQSGAFDVVLFDNDITTGTNNAAYDMADADGTKYIGHISITSGDYSSFSDNAVGVVSNIGLVYWLSGTDHTLRVQLVARGTPTYNPATDLYISLGILTG